MCFDKAVCPDFSIDMIQVVNHIDGSFNYNNSKIFDLSVFFKQYEPIFGCSYRFIMEEGL